MKKMKLTNDDQLGLRPYTFFKPRCSVCGRVATHYIVSDYDCISQNSQKKKYWEKIAECEGRGYVVMENSRVCSRCALLRFLSPEEKKSFFKIIENVKSKKHK